MDKSHRPHSHPNQHTEQELKLITDMRRRNPNAGLVVFWVKLRQRGYTRSITSLYRILLKTNLKPKKLPNPKYVPKPYEKMLFPGQRVQIDVKFVPSACLVGDAKHQKFYQYTALDEYSRFRYIEAFEEHSSYSSAVFLDHLIKAFPFPIHCVQTDNGQEFTKRLSKTQNPSPTLFEKVLKKHGISHKLIRPYTLPDITAKSNVLTEKTMSIFMLHTLSIRLMILKNNLLFTTENTIISLCVLFTGIPPLITLILSYSMANFSNSLFVTHH